jgi:transposase
MKYLQDRSGGMGQENNGPIQDEPLLKIIQSLRDGLISGKLLDKEVRQDVVDFLRLEGTSVAEIAQVLGLSDKTIKRDIKDAKEKNALKFKSAFVTEMVGELVRKGAQHWQSLKSFARNQSATINEKILAEKAAWDVELGLCHELRELGYLPSAPKAIVGQFSHQVNVSGDNTWEDLFQQYLQLKELAVDRNGVVDVEVQRTLEEIEPAIQDGLAKQKVQDTLSMTEKKLQEDHHGQE